MKKIYSTLMLSALLAGNAFAQDATTAAESNDAKTTSTKDEKTEASKEEDASAGADKFTLKASFRSGLTTHGDGNGDVNSKFALDQMRLDMGAQLNDRVSFRFRTKYTTDPKTGGDGASRAIDMAYVNLQLLKDSDKFILGVGKTYTEWGGYEFDFNAVDVYRYSDLQNSNSECYLTGAQLYYKFNPKHTFVFQVQNSSAVAQSDRYVGNKTAANGSRDYAATGNMHLATTINWKGTFSDKLGVMSSFTHYNEAVDSDGNKLGSSFFIIGAKYNVSDKFALYADYSFANGGIDRDGIISAYMDGSHSNGNGNSNSDLNGAAVKGTFYNDIWLRGEYQIHPKWRAVLSTFVTVGSATSYERYITSGTTYSSGNYYNSFGVNPVVEYFPFAGGKMKDVKVYASYTAYTVNFSEMAMNEFGNEGYMENEFKLGLTAPLTIF